MSQIAKWTLMHKNVKVANLDIFERSAAIIQINKTYNKTHAPLGTIVDEEIDSARLEHWLNKRAIPASRNNIDQILEGLKIQNTRALALKSYGLSLSDQYWLRPSNEEIIWEKINFFQNDFSLDMGEILFREKEILLPNVNFYSPDSSADGWLEKKWIIKDDKRVLIKGANWLYRQEPFNEKIASDIMEKLEIDHISYDITTINDKSYSLCENFITTDTELIPAVDIVSNEPQQTGDTRMTHLLRACNNLGMNNKTVKTKIDQMLVIDYLIGNYDRHWRNFGFIRDANTLEFMGFAPIFDSGASLWQHHEIIDDNVKSETKFAETLPKQLKLITDLSWYRPIPDDKLREIILLTLAQHPTMTKERQEKIAEQVVKNGHEIGKLQNKLHKNG